MPTGPPVSPLPNILNPPVIRSQHPKIQPHKPRGASCCVAGFEKTATPFFGPANAAISYGRVRPLGARRAALGDAGPAVPVSRGGPRVRRRPLADIPIHACTIS
jgi:hypothetical protein